MTTTTMMMNYRVLMSCLNNIVCRQAHQNLTFTPPHPAPPQPTRPVLVPPAELSRKMKDDYRLLVYTSAEFQGLFTCGISWTFHRQMRSLGWGGRLKAPVNWWWTLHCFQNFPDYTNYTDWKTKVGYNEKDSLSGYTITSDISVASLMNTK